MAEIAAMFVSPLVSLLIENLAPFASSFIPSGGNHRKLEKWTDMLQMIQAVLEDPEDTQFNVWLKKFKELAFEIEDVVDDLLTEAGRRQMIATPESSRSRSKLPKFFPKFNHKAKAKAKAISFNYDLDRKIGEISDSLKRLEEQKNIMKLLKCVGGKSDKPGYQKPQSTSLLDTTRVYGRDEESSAILKLLLEDKASDHDGQVRVISIVGMGGIGKSTLAQSLYNNEGVKGSYDNRAWVSVTEDFDVLKISKIIYVKVYNEGLHHLQGTISIITELKGLHHLQGTISIIGIEKVMNVQDATKANLSCNKEGLHGLEMNWSNNFGGTREGRLELEVLKALKPRRGLASLEIEFYGGQKFPSWVGDHSFCDMVKVRLIGCKNCTYLPPLGQLTSLKELFIGGMDGVKVVGPEFLGSCSPHNVAFQSLIDLSFRDMKGWEEWCVDENLVAFPSLQNLEMWSCRKLKKVSLPKIPSLVSLKLSSCGEMILRSMVGVGSVKKLNIYDISGLSKLNEGIIECLGGVEELRVIDCRQLRYLWEEEVACQILRKLKLLDVRDCEELELLGDEEQLLPHNLESLGLWVCDKLEKMPNWQNNLTSLRRLCITNCKKLKDSLVSTTYLEHKIEKQGVSWGSYRRLGEYEFSNPVEVVIR